MFVSRLRGVGLYHRNWLVFNLIIIEMFHFSIMVLCLHLFTFFHYVIDVAGASIHACRNVDRHIAALEEDKAIFEAVIAPLIRALVTRRCLQPRVVMGLDDIDEEDIVVELIVKKSQFSK